MPVAESHGWSLDGVTIRELIPAEDGLDPDQQNTMFHPSELELASTTKPDPGGRGALEADPAGARLACRSCGSWPGPRCDTGGRSWRLKQFFSTRDCTVLLLDDMTATDHDMQMQSIAHGVVLLEQLHPEYGAERRRLRVVKYRGVKFRGGLPRFRDPAGRAAGVSAAGRGRASPGHDPRQAQQRHPRARRAAGRRDRRRARARSSSARRERASRRWPRSSARPPARAASAPPSSSSTRAPTRC